MIASILKNNEPAADKLLIATLCLGYACAMLTLFCIMAFAMVHNRRDPKATDSEDSDAIELTEIKVSGGAPTAGERTTIRAPRSMYNRAGRSVVSGLRTPPPLYSLDGYSRSTPRLNRTI
jgi:hypothetical protein